MDQKPFYEAKKKSSTMLTFLGKTYRSLKRFEIFSSFIQQFYFSIFLSYRMLRNLEKQKTTSKFLIFHSTYMTFRVSAHFSKKIRKMCFFFKTIPAKEIMFYIIRKRKILVSDYFLKKNKV